MTLRTKVIVLILLSTCGIITLSTATMAVRTAIERRHELTTQTRVITNMLAQGLARPMWDQNQPAIEGMITALANDPGISAAEVTDENGQIIATLRSPVHADSTITDSAMIIYLRDGKSEHVGTIHVSRSADALWSLLRDQIISLLVSLLATCLCVAAAVVLAFRLISKPLQRIALAAQQHGEGNHDISLPECDRQDEIGNIARAVELSCRQVATIERLRRDQEHYLHLVYDGAVDGICVTDDENRVETFNPAAQTIFGWTADEIHGRPVGEILPELAGPAGLLPADDGTRLTGMEMLGRRKSGELVPLSVSASSFMLGSRRKHSLVVHDISHHKKAEEALILARQAAEDASRTKSTFLANMSHEIRTPMNAIIGLCHLILASELEGRNRDYVEKIDQSAKALLGIINDILDFSKIEAGKLSMESVAFDLDDVFSLVATMAAPRAEEKGLELIFALEPDLPARLVGDPTRLGQILLNLCANAIKFTENGEVQLSARPDGRQNGKIRLAFAVKDTGIGLSRGQIDLLFSAFNQADASITRRYGGTGLGLAICKRLIELMDGQIGVDSEPGKGSTFWFNVSLPEAEAPAAGLPGPDFFDSLDVLIIDDNETSREVLARYLASFGCRVAEASSGPEGVALFCQAPEPFGLVITDWKMPGMDGLEVAKHIRKAPNGTIPQIIMISAYDNEEIISRAKQDGFSAYLVKPVSPSTLMDTIRGVFHKETLPRPRLPVGPHMLTTGLSGTRVLVVEDNDINLQVTRDILESAGIQVVVAENGRQGIDMLMNGDTVDAVLMDVQMPLLDGYAATRIIRQNGRFADLPVIAMTANASVEDRERARDAGMNDYIGKPVDVPQMFAVLRRWIRPRPISEDGPAQASLAVGAQPLPPFLPGIDQDAGLRRTLGNVGAYRRLLKRFGASEADFETRFDKAFEAGDLKQCMEIAHRLVGVAGTIGAMAIHQTAGRLQDVCRDGISPEEIRLAQKAVSGALREVLEGLVLLEPPVGPQLPDGSGTPLALAQIEASIALLPELFILLQRGDTDALAAAQNLRALLKGSRHEPLVRKLIEHVDGYDFEAAVPLVRSLEKMLEEEMNGTEAPAP